MVTKRDRKLAHQIKLIRRRKKLTQEAVADKVRVTPKYIQYLEGAKRVPSIKLLYRIADTLDVKVKELFTF